MPPGKRTIFEMMLHHYWHNIELFILDISRYYRSLDQDPIWISTSPPSTDGRKHSNATSVRWLIYLISNFYFYVFKTWNFVYFIEGIWARFYFEYTHRQRPPKGEALQVWRLLKGWN